MASKTNIVTDNQTSNLSRTDVFKPTINAETLAATRTLLVTDYIAQWLDPNGADRDVNLPAEASSTNLMFIILNTANGAGEDLVVKSDAPATIATLGPGMMGMFSCDGTNWKYESDTGVFYDSVSGNVGIGNTDPRDILHVDGGSIVGDQHSNQMVNLASAQILGLMTDARFLNLLCENPAGGVMTDISMKGHDGTYQGTMTLGDRINKGSGWALDFDGTDDYINLGDSDDFSFGDGSNDSPFTIFGCIEVVNSATYQILISKWDSTIGAELREYILYLQPDETIQLELYDESANVSCFTKTNSTLSVGWHSIAATYDGAGGATAADTIKIYIDGVEVASTATNNGSYVAMENLATPVWLGARENNSGVAAIFFQGDITHVGIDAVEWSAIDAWRHWLTCRGLYSL